MSRKTFTPLNNDSLDTQTGRHRLSTAMVQDFEQKPLPVHFQLCGFSARLNHCFVGDMRMSHFAEWQSSIVAHQQLHSQIPCPGHLFG